MESGFCVLSDTEDLQMLISNTATNLHNERWVESRCWFIALFRLQLFFKLEDYPLVIVIVSVLQSLVVS